ncbi:MAG TPA: hypothetical protein VKA09_04785 [Nitrososphaeraceae archaeon]|jgi:hypothetical protein|nr:hypothetical protein [Nitrososphaeraceae archaeon]
MFPFQTLDISDDLRNCEVTRFEKENNVNLLLEHNGRSVVLFKIHESGGLFDTLEDFRIKSRGRIDSDTVQAIILVLSREKYYQDVLRNSKITKPEPDDQNTPETDIVEPPARESNVKNETTDVIDPFAALDQHVVDKDYAEYVIRTAKKTVKQEDALVRQIVYVGLSKDSDNPLNLAVLARTRLMLCFRLYSTFPNKICGK